VTSSLKDYLSRIPNAQQLSSTDLESYQQEMVNIVIPKNLRAVAEKKRLAIESRFRAAQASAKRDRDDG
jgi:hypothetical protein